MPFPRGFTITVSRFHRTNDGDWAASGTSFTIDGCAVSPSSKRTYESDSAFQDSTRAELVLLAPPRSGIAESDRITLPDGTVWEVWGYPVDFASPLTGWAPGSQIQLRRFTG